MTDRRRLRIIVAGGVALLSVLVYANSLANGFAYDDVSVVVSRDLVHGLGRIPELLTAEYWPARFGSGLYRPLTMLSFALDWSAWGGRPFGFHLTNLLLHAAVTALLAVLLLRFFPWWAALAGGVVFAVHPVHTEAVANVVGRAELLAAAFVLLACLAYVDAARRGRLSWVALVIISASYALAVLSKEVGVVLPALLLLLDLPLAASGRIGDGKAYLRTRLPLFASLATVLLAYLVLRWAVLGEPVSSLAKGTFAPDAGFSTRLFTMARVWPRYYELLLFPAELSADYSPAVILPASQLTLLGAMGFALVLATVILALVLYRRAPEFSMAVGWAAVTLLPVSNLIIAAEIVLAERTLYLPSLAVSVIGALLLVRARRAQRRWVALGLAVWVIGFSVVTVRRNPVWQDSETVFTELQRQHPESSRVLWWLGYRQLGRGDWVGAREWFRRSLEVWPYSPAYLSAFAVLLKDHGELVEAEAMAARAVEIGPNYADHHSLLAVIRLRLGDNEGALRVLARGRDAVGERAVFYGLEADAYANQGEFARAARAQLSRIRLGGTAATWEDWLELAELQVAASDTAAAWAALDSAAAAGAPDVKVDSLERGLRAYRRAQQ
ncbi:MAG: tetratricopeptide repeat protein [Gemmatimonadota bacterium]|nr:MAG: tetratricopeptide repeat protein [Gemmatimonadota bacterium]